MNEEQIRQWMMERLYGEISQEDAKRLDGALSQHAELAQEWQDAQAAHRMISQVKDSDAPYMLQDAIHQAARNLPANSSPSFRWGRWLAAAVILVASGAVYLEWNGNTPVSTSALSKEASLPKITMGAPLKLKTNSIDESESQQLNQVRMMKAAPSADSSDSIALASSKGHIDRKINSKSAADAESLFRTGLGVYNQAFTKIGDERHTLLKSAIITLSDVVKHYPEQSEWAAMAMTLIADSHRALDDVDAAIQTYETLINQCPESDEICKQARVSLIELLLTQDDRTTEVDQQLHILAEREKQSDEFASLALTASNKIGEKDPEQAYSWAMQVLSTWPPQHIYHQKAQRFASQYFEDAMNSCAIKQWWKLGPLESFSVQFEDVPPVASTKRFNGYDHKTVAWEKIQQENSQIDFSKDGIKQDAYRAVFLATNVESPKNQVVLFSLKAKARALLYVNDEMVWKGAMNRAGWRQPQWAAARNEIKCSLKQGWNRIVFKVFFPTGKSEDTQFSVTILDTDHNIKHDLSTSY